MSVLEPETKVWVKYVKGKIDQTTYAQCHCDDTLYHVYMTSV